MSVLFADLVGSTQLSARLDPSDYLAILETFRRIVADAVGQHGGEIVQIYGDGALVIFGHHRGHRSSVQAAVSSGVAIRRKIADIGLPVPAGVSRLQVHCGVHAGIAICRRGDMRRGRIEVVGHATAIAAKLSAAAGPGEILVSAESVEPTGRGFSLGPIRAIAAGAGEAPFAAYPVIAVEAVGSTLHERNPSGLHGREEMLVELGELLRAHPAVRFRICIAGPAGQGKSRLAEAFVQRARTAGFDVLRGACPQLAGRPMLSMFPGSGGPADAPTWSAEGSDQQDRMIAALRERSTSQPLLVVMDDWHFADIASRQLLVRMLEALPSIAVLLLSRDHRQFELPEGFSEQHLPPLDPQATARLVLDRRPDFDPIDASHVHARSGGNPLVIEAICHFDVRFLRETRGPGNQSHAPGWLAASIAERLDRLPPAARRILERAAVVGDSIPRWLLEGVTSRSRLTSILQRLETEELLRIAGSRLFFHHGLTREICYQLIPEAARAALHREIAQAVEEATDCPGLERSDALALHHAACGAHDRAWPHALASGDLALRRGAWDRAQDHFRAGLASLTAMPASTVPAQALAELVNRFGMASVFDSDPDQLPVLEKARQVAFALGDSQILAVVDYWTGYILHGSGQQKRAIDLLDCTRRQSPLPSGSPFMVQLSATLGEALAAAGRHSEAEPILDHAIEVKRVHRSGRKPSIGLAYTLACRAVSHADRGHFAAADEAVAEALDAIAGAAHPVEASILGWSAVIHCWRGDWERAEEVCRLGQAIAIRSGTLYLHAVSRGLAGLARWYAHGDDDGVAALEAAIIRMASSGRFLGFGTCLGFLAEVRAERGDAPGARQAIAGALARARAGDLLGVSAAARVAAFLETSRPGRACAWLQLARANAARRQSFREQAHCDVLEARLRERAGGDGRALRGAACSRFRDCGMDWHAGRARTASERRM